MRVSQSALRSTFNIGGARRYTCGSNEKEEKKMGYHPISLEITQ
jgi:hypothetical protein